MSTTPDFSTAAWRKSSYSNGGDANCVEVADGFTGIVPVRDSKDPAVGTLAVAGDAWTGFIAAVRGGTL